MKKQIEQPEVKVVKMESVDICTASNFETMSANAASITWHNIQGDF